MDRISLNLLPLDLKENKLFEQKKRLINRLSVLLLSTLVVITLGLVVVSVFQKNQIDAESNKLASYERTLGSLAEREAALLLLKQRLASIVQIQNLKYPQTDSFLLISALIPEKTTIQAFSVDQANKITLSGYSENAASLQLFFDNLTNPQMNEGKITKTTIVNLNRGNAPRMLFELDITTTQAVENKK